MKPTYSRDAETVKKLDG